MRACNLVTIGVLVLCGAAHSTAAQQEPRRALSLGLAAGTTLPVGPAVKALERGPRAGAAIEVRSPYPGIALRVEGTYDSFRMHSGVASDSAGESVGMLSGSMRLLGGTANVVLRAPYREDPVRPYVIGGVGVFRVQSHFEHPTEHGWLRYTDRARIRTGANAGLGVEVPRERVTAFVDARYHFVRNGESSLRMMALSLGLRTR